MFFKFTIFIPVFIILIIDIFTFIRLKLLVRSYNGKWRNILYYLFWIITFLFLSITVYLVLNKNNIKKSENILLVYKFIGLFTLVYFPKLIFILFTLFDEIRFLISKLLAIYLWKNKSADLKFFRLKKRIGIISILGIVIVVISTLSILYGILFGWKNFQVQKVELAFHNLPSTFNSFKLVQVSDLHLGSFIGNEDLIKRMVEIINIQEPDLVVFTGDWINNYAYETNSFIPYLSKIKSKYGNYGILGNHDYGDYSTWNSEYDKFENHSDLLKAIKHMNFKLLLNQNVVISNGRDSIYLIGVENWGKPPFPQYGKLEIALNNCNKDAFQILLTHDPSHWDKEVVPDTDIPLSLSGHTHGFQFGIKIGSWQWSPVSFFYPKWAGLYKSDNQLLYVNRGVGVIGFPGRIGMPPEITVIKLMRTGK